MRYSRLRRYKIKKTIEYFIEDITISSVAKNLKLNRKTVNGYYNEFESLILEHSLREQKKELGKFELDESYFGARRVRGKRDRGAARKTPFLGVLKRNRKVFVTFVPNCSRKIIQGKILEDSMIYTDG